MESTGVVVKTLQTKKGNVVSADDVAEWVGLHYGRNFDKESKEEQTEWASRYAVAHGVDTED